MRGHAAVQQRRRSGVGEMMLHRPGLGAWRNSRVCVPHPIVTSSHSSEQGRGPRACILQGKLAEASWKGVLSRSGLLETHMCTPKKIDFPPHLYALSFFFLFLILEKKQEPNRLGVLLRDFFFGGTHVCLEQTRPPQTRPLWRLGWTGTRHAPSPRALTCTSPSLAPRPETLARPPETLARPRSPRWVAASTTMLKRIALLRSAYRTRLSPQLKKTRSMKSVTAIQETKAMSAAHDTFKTHRALYFPFQQIGHFPKLLGDERASD